MPIRGEGCPSRNPPRLPPTPWRAPSGTSSPPATRDHPRMFENRWKKFRGFDGCRGHPRVCGEQYPVQPANTLWLGSSPRVRGAGIAVRRVGAVDGIIPACAGSSRASGREHPCVQDHPRVCGEQELPFAALVLLTGSSPRVRGGVHWLQLLIKNLGIIPTRAGRRLRRRSTLPLWDHPRAWGTGVQRNLAALRIRIIPACAGNISDHFSLDTV